MFTIRSQHQDAFLPQGEAFVPWAIKHLQDNHAEAIADLSAEVLEQRVRVGMQRADRHRLTSATARLAFIALMFEVAPNFDEQTAIKRILANFDVPDMTRMEQLTQQVKFVEWQEAEDNYQAQAWKS